MRGKFVPGIFLLALLLLLSSAGAVASSAGDVGKVSMETRAYTEHDVIRINSDADFVAQGFPGSGTQDEPYVIAWYKIDANGEGAGIYIGNTTAYFVVEHNLITNASRTSVPYYAGAGITIYNAIHGIVRNNDVISNDYGIYVSGNSNGIEVSHNNATGSENYGIWITLSNNITVSYNNASDNRGSTLTAGIDVYGSYNVTIQYNTCRNNKDGIYVGGPSHDNVIKFNNCSNNSDNGIYLSTSSTEANNNTLIYGNDLYGNQYGIHLHGSKNVEIRRNNVIQNYYDGVYLDTGSPNNTIWENTILRNGRNGIHVYTYSTSSPSDYNVIMWNNASENAGSGLYIDRTSYNIVHNNMFYNNSGYGVSISSGSSGNVIYENSFYFNHGSNETYDSSHIQAYDDGSGNRWNISYEGNYWYDWTSPDNDPPTGIVDNPYEIDGSANSKDELPLTEKTPVITEITPAIFIGVLAVLFVAMWRRGL